MPLTNEIALSMIVKDCAKELDTCLKSAEGFYDFLSITDTGSQDDTLEVAKQHNAHISHYEYPSNWPHPFLDNFSKARNLSLSMVPKNIKWITWLDSDDLLIGGMELRDAVLNIKDGMFTINLDYKNQEYHPTRPRLWTNGALLWEGRVHEELIELKETTSYRFNGKSHVYHNRSKNAVRKHQERDVILLRLDIEEKQTIENSFQLACHLLTLDIWRKNSNEAIELLQYVIQEKDKEYEIIRMKANYKLALTNLRLGNYNDALLYCSKVTDQKGKFEEFLFYQNTLKIISKIGELGFLRGNSFLDEHQRAPAT